MNRLEAFSQHRPLLFGIAYRMLGSVADAEDILQEAWLRWQPVNEIQSPKAFLSSLVTRLCIDHLRSAHVRREQYVGTWLPEPLIAEQISYSQDYAELAESLKFAFLTLLECLSPTERAIFLLREVFNYSYVDIAKIVDKSVSNCRQINHRARQRLILRRPSVSPSPQRQEELIEQFCACWNQGDVHQLISMMAEDITFWADGGGQVVAVQKPLHGCLKVSRFLIALRRSKRIPNLIPRIFQINGQPAVINVVSEQPQSIFNFEFSGDCIKSIFAVVNPEKLRAIELL